MNIDDILKLGIGGGALFVLYALLKPLITALINGQSEFVKNQQLFAKALEQMVGVIAELRADLHLSAERVHDALDDEASKVRSALTLEAQRVRDALSAEAARVRQELHEHGVRASHPARIA